MPDARLEILGHTAKIAAAYLSKNPIAPEAIAKVLTEIRDGLAALDQSSTAGAPPDKPVPAVPIRRSVTPDYIVCLEDGKKLKMLKRHLQASFGMTPDDYRAKWGLAPDYPMVAPSYAALRSEFAKQIGLGKQRSAPPPVMPEPVAKPKAGRTRGVKAG